MPGTGQGRNYNHRNRRRMFEHRTAITARPSPRHNPPNIALTEPLVDADVNTDPTTRRNGAPMAAHFPNVRITFVSKDLFLQAMPLARRLRLRRANMSAKSEVDVFRDILAI